MKTSRVLLVDDNPEFLAVSKEFLDAHDWLEVVGTATSAQEALDVLEKLEPTLLITDLVMPGISGLDLTKQVKERSPNLPVVVMTMHDTPRHRDAAIAAGAAAFVTKASMDSELLPVIRRLQAADAA